MVLLMLTNIFMQKVFKLSVFKYLKCKQRTTILDIIGNGRRLAWRSRSPGFKPHWGQFLTNCFCSSMCKELSDNLRETPSWKTQLWPLTHPHFMFLHFIYDCLLLWARIAKGRSLHQLKPECLHIHAKVMILARLGWWASAMVKETNVQLESQLCLVSILFYSTCAPYELF